VGERSPKGGNLCYEGKTSEEKVKYAGEIREKRTKTLKGSLVNTHIG